MKLQYELRDRWRGISRVCYKSKFGETTKATLRAPGIIKYDQKFFKLAGAYAYDDGSDSGQTVLVYDEVEIVDIQEI